MATRVIPPLLLLLSFVIPFRTASAGQQNPDENRLVVNANYVAVGATVTDTAGKFADGLRAGNFQILDNGVEQPIAYFALDRPTDVLVLIEAGPAVYLIAGGHLRAATALLQGLSPQDRVAVVKYAETPEGISDFNADKRVSAEALERLRFFLGSGALNLSGSMSTVLDWLDKTPGQKTIVLLSTGVDTSSPDSAANLLQRLRVGDVRVLAVSLLGDLRTPPATNKKKPPSNAAILTAQQFATADETLRQLAAATGGRAYFPVDAKAFDTAYQEIAQIVRHQYSLGFLPPQLDGKVHTLDVRVTPPAEDAGSIPAKTTTIANPLRVDHRQAYIASKPAAP